MSASGTPRITSGIARGAAQKYVCVERVGGAPAHGDRHRGEQQTEEHRARVAHEDPRRVEVVRQEPGTDAHGDRGHERRHVRALEQTGFEETVGVQEDRGAGDEHDPAGQAVEAVDQVDRVRQDHHREDGHERREIGGEDHVVVARERHAEVQHGDAEQGQDAAAEHLARDLRRGRHVAQVVDRPHDEHHRGGEEQPERLGVAREDLVELSELRCHRHRDEEADEHAGTAERRRGHHMDAARSRHRDGTDARRDPSHDERREEGDDRGDARDGQVSLH